MNWKVVLETALRVAQQVPLAIAAAACVVEMGEEIVAGVLTASDENSSPEDQPEGLARQVSTLFAALRRIKKAVWPSPMEEDDFVDVSPEPVSIVPLNVIPLRSDPC